MRNLTARWWDEDGDEDKGELRQAWCRFTFLGKVDHSASKKKNSQGGYEISNERKNKKESINERLGVYNIVRAFNKCLYFSEPHNMSTI
jgi:hypothetical protein